MLCFVVVLALLWKKRLVQHVGLRIRLGCAPESERERLEISEWVRWVFAVAGGVMLVAV